jgi:hypothetical protein
MVRKLPNFVSTLFEALMSFLLDIEDEQDWHRVRGRWGERGMQTGRRTSRQHKGEMATPFVV